MSATWALTSAAALVILGGLMGCTGNRPWRVPPAGIANPPPDSASSWLRGQHGEETLIVEFDDQGEMWGEGERDFALGRLRELARDSKPLTLLVFVHGWHHNAKDGDANLESFRRVLSDLAQVPAFQDRRWAGLYLGWRGESIDLPLLRYTTFWNRRNAAARVGGIPAAHFLSDVGSIVQARAENMLIVVGHSFGGRVVETAITNAMTFNEGKPLLDLVVLLNEASEGLRAKTAIDTFKHDSGIDADDPPQIVSITSVGDAATGIAFPFGQALASLNERFRGYDEYGTADERALPGQGTLFRHTAGHTAALSSHVLMRPSAVPGWQARPDITPFSVKGLAAGSSPDYLLVPVDRGYNKSTPYWIVQVPKEIIVDHDDIFNEHLRGMLAGIVAKWFKAPQDVKQRRLMKFKNNLQLRAQKRR